MKKYSPRSGNEGSSITTVGKNEFVNLPVSYVTLPDLAHCCCGSGLDVAWTLTSCS